MTLAICIKCGEEKLGAFTPCRQCRFTPELMEDKAKALLLSDHYQKVVELRQIGQRIKAGERLSFDEGQIAEMAEELTRMPEVKMPLGCQIAVWIPIIFMFLLIAALIGLVIYIRSV